MEKQSKKKRLPVVVRVLLILAGVLAALLLAMAALGWNLLNKVNRPSAPTEFEADAADTPLPGQTDTPLVTLTPSAAGGTANASPAPERTPLPLSEVYSQTELDDATRAWMEQNQQKDSCINVLLLGVDRRGSSGKSRADVMMIATVDKEHNRLKLTSVMRDMLVQIPGLEDYDRLNQAAAHGGVELLEETLNNMFQLKISDYVLVDFRMFEEIIDAMDGVTVKMTAEEISAANDCIAGLNREWGASDLWDGFIFANAGNVKLTGKQALGFVRVRKIDSEFSRTKRQFSVLNAVYAKFMSLSATKQYALLSKLLPLVETNMANTRILELGTSALGMDVNGLSYCRIPADDLYKNGRYDRKSILFIDAPANALALHKFIYESAEEGITATVLAPGESLPPRTPNPTAAIVGSQPASGSIAYYNGDQPVYLMYDEFGEPYYTVDPPQ